MDILQRLFLRHLSCNLQTPLKKIPSRHSHKMGLHLRLAHGNSLRIPPIIRSPMEHFRHQHMARCRLRSHRQHLLRLPFKYPRFKRSQRRNRQHLHLRPARHRHHFLHVFQSRTPHISPHSRLAPHLRRGLPRQFKNRRNNSLNSIFYPNRRYCHPDKGGISLISTQPKSLSPFSNYQIIKLIFWAGTSPLVRSSVPLQPFFLLKIHRKFKFQFMQKKMSTSGAVYSGSVLRI